SKLGEHTLQARLACRVDVGHAGPYCGVSSADEPVHLLCDRSVGRMSLLTRAQLDQVHGLTCVQIEHVTNAVGEAQWVGGRSSQVVVSQARVLGRRDVKRALIVLEKATRHDLIGYVSPP